MLGQNSDMSGSRPEMSTALVIDTFADIAKRSVNLLRMYAERLNGDDGYQVMDPPTVASTFQEFFQKAPWTRNRFKQSVELWANLGLLCQLAFY
jgi:hypothetical protein